MIIEHAAVGSLVQLGCGCVVRRLHLGQRTVRVEAVVTPIAEACVHVEVEHACSADHLHTVSVAPYAPCEPI